MNNSLVSIIVSVYKAEIYSSMHRQPAGVDLQEKT